MKDLPRMLPTKFRFIWQSGFREEDFKKSANQKQELPMAAMFVNGSGQNEQFHRWFLPSFTSFDWGDSEKIKMWKVNGRQTTDAKWWQKLTLPSARWANNNKNLYLVNRNNSNDFPQYFFVFSFLSKNSELQKKNCPINNFFAISSKLWIVNPFQFRFFCVCVFFHIYFMQCTLF